MLEILNSFASIATATGVAVAAWQILLAHRQGVTTFEDSLAKEYREIAATLPTKALLGEALSDSEYVNHFDEFYRYIDLCNEQAFLFKGKRISDKTWAFWRDGIVCNLRRPSFARAWSEIAFKTPSDFSELRSVCTPNAYQGGAPDPHTSA